MNTQSLLVIGDRCKSALVWQINIVKWSARRIKYMGTESRRLRFILSVCITRVCPGGLIFYSLDDDVSPHSQDERERNGSGVQHL